VLTAAPPIPAPARLRSLDLLRLVAALAVLLFHVTARDHGRWAGGLPAEVLPHLAPVTRYGYLGVHLFFVISGFVVLTSARGRSTRAFVASRVSRLYPAYWAAVLLTAALRWAWPAFEARTPAEVLVNLTMLQDPLGVARVDGVYWTLWVELQFYVLVALLVRAGPGSRRVLAFSAVAPVAAAGVTLTRPDAAGVLTLVEWLPLFCAGMVLSLIHRDRSRPVLWCALALDVTLAAAVAAVRTPRAVDAIASGTPTSAAVVVAGVVGAVVLVAVCTLRVRDRGPRWFTVAGLLTYPLYLTHEYVAWATVEALSPRLGTGLTLAVATAVCLAVAAAVHLVVERPVQQPLRRLLDRPRVRRRAGPAPVGGARARAGQASPWEARV